jgi:hypothetical protein
MTLRISDTLSLPIDAVTSKFAILAVSGAGKSYSGSVIAEEMIAAGLRVVVVDPVGVWWGLRSSADGESPGLPAVVFGGERADVELREDLGEAIADLVVDGTFSCVLDLSSLATKAAERRFLTAFAQRLYRRKATAREPLHLILDEADTYCPQKPMGEEARLLGAIQEIVRRGRARGIGCTLITQRAASLSKDVLTQIETLIVLRTTSPQDRAAIDGWVEANASREERSRVVDSLPSLKTGEAWVWSPSFLGVLQRLTIRRRRTFDSSATPKVGEKRIEPRALAPVDLDAIRRALPAEEVKAEPKSEKALRARIAELEAELAARPAVEPERVEVPVHVLSSGETETLSAAVEELGRHAETLTNLGVEIKDALGMVARASAVAAGSAIVAERGRPTTTKTTDDDVRDHPVAPAPSALKILRALATSDRPLARQPLALVSGVSPKSSSYGPHLAQLRDAALIEETPDGYRITKAGRATVGGAKAPTDPAELRRLWVSKMSSPSAERMLAAIFAAYPKSLTRDAIARHADVSITSSSFGPHLKEIVSLGLAEKRPDGSVVASSTLFIGGRHG